MDSEVRIVGNGCDAYEVVVGWPKWANPGPVLVAVEGERRAMVQLNEESVEKLVLALRRDDACACGKHVLPAGWVLVVESQRYYTETWESHSQTSCNVPDGAGFKKVEARG